MDTTDGIDGVIIQAETVPFNALIIDRLRRAPSLVSRDLFRLDRDFAVFCADAIRRFISDHDLNVDLVSSHGHTVFHQPGEGYTVQIGHGAVIAEQLQIPVVSDVRMNDMALGGQGAPIVPVVERLLLRGHKYYLNLGGIANISIHDQEEITAYDVCPCNQIMNAEAQRLGQSFDSGGYHASSGSVDELLLKSWDNMDYFKALPPKSLDNTWVMTEFYGKVNPVTMGAQDVLATMCAFVARQLAQAVSYQPDLSPHSMLVTGGGAHNDYLIEQIRLHLAPLNVSLFKPAKDIIDFKECLLMALMGYLRVNGQTNTIPSVTGALRATVGGALYQSGPSVL